MYVITIITFLIAFIEVISCGRFYNYNIMPGQSGISLSQNMFRKTKETKEDMERYLRDNAPFRKYNQAPLGKPKRTKDDFEQYLYEKYNDLRKSSSHKQEQSMEDQKYFFDNAPYRKSLQQFRSLPVLVIGLKNSRLDNDGKYLRTKVLRTEDNVKDDISIDPDDENIRLNNDYKYVKPKKVLRTEENGKDDFTVDLDDENIRVNNDFEYVKTKKVLRIEENVKDDFSIDPDGDKIYLTSNKKTDENVEDVNKEVLRLAKEGKLECKVNTRRKHKHYDSTSSSSSREFHSGEKRQFQLWRKEYVCGDKVMPKFEPPPDDQELRPNKYKGTNKVLNEMLEAKRGGGQPLKMQPPKQLNRGIVSPLRKTDVNQYLVPPRVEFEFSELVN